MRPQPRSEAGPLLAVLALLAAASLPFARIFVGLGVFRPLAAAGLLAVGLAWGARRLGAGPVVGLAAGVLGWVAFVSVAFLPGTLRLGVVPSAETWQGLIALWNRGFQLIGLRPPPVLPEAGLVLLTVTGVWAVAHVVTELGVRLRSPLKAITAALPLWITPLAIDPDGWSTWVWAVPFLAAAGALLLTSSSTELGRWGRHVADFERASVATRIAPSGTAVGTTAILCGALFAGLLPGFGQAPWYELRGVGGTTLTDNPMVTIRPSLVSPDYRPILQVRTAQPVYLRTTSLDIYSDREEWTNAGIRGTPVRGRLPFERLIADHRIVDVDVEIAQLSGAVIVPAPYQAVEARGDAAERFQYDPRLSTLTLDRGASLEPGDQYAITAVVPDPPPDIDPGIIHDPASPLTALPDTVPPAVVDLAHDIVARAEARTPFEQALAIQRELRTWTYSLAPPPGHDGSAMEAFVTNQIGYCEQYAGTMAVMLRALGIPARVAVGFTPGERVTDEDTATYRTDPRTGAARRVDRYVVTTGHAHAWVEVLSARHGWLAFEPTPRADGNVLVPSAVNLAPSRLVSDLTGEADVGAGLLPEDMRALPPEMDGAQPGAPDGADVAPGRRSWLMALLVVGLAAAAGVVFAVRRSRGPQEPAPSPAVRVLRARTRVERLGRGLGMAPRPSETDREYLGRLAVAFGNGEGPRLAAACSLLAGRAAQARYARSVADEAAADAELAAAEVRGQLLEGLGAPRRVIVAARGELSAGLAAASARLAVSSWDPLRRSDGSAAAPGAGRRPRRSRPGPAA